MLPAPDRRSRHGRFAAQPMGAGSDIEPPVDGADALTSRAGPVSHLACRRAERVRTSCTGSCIVGRSVVALEVLWRGRVTPGMPPSGVVTFLFTDIEGSTRLWEQFPDQMEVALARHDEIVRAALEAAGGYVFKTVGDAFCSSFRSPLGAVEAATEIQRALATEDWPADARLRVRIALHSGWCEPRDGDYFGTPVNVVARLEAAAHGGQIVCSQATAELLGRVPGHGAQLAFLGAHELAGLSVPVGVSQINVPGLQVEFPRCARPSSPRSPPTCRWSAPPSSVATRRWGR